MNEMVVDAKKPIGLEMVSLKMKKEHCLIFFFFGFYATNGVRDKTYFRFASIKLQN